MSFGEKRINEALKLGFEEVIVPYSTAKDLKNINSIKVTGVKDVKMALAEAFK